MFILDFENQTSKNITLEHLKQIANELSTKDVELVACNNEYIKKINNQFRQKNTATDVLSFPFEDMPFAPLGSILISIEYAEEKASLYKHGFEEEFTLLFIHGFLHLLGYDHEVDNGEHREKEKELIKKYKLPDSLIVRND